MADRIPEICDYDCPAAEFPPADTAGICRTMSAVWCKKLRELVNKNVPCTWRRRGGDGAAAGGRHAAAKRPKRTRSRR